MSAPDSPGPPRAITSVDTLWAFLGRLMLAELRFAQQLKDDGIKSYAYEFLRFGVKLGWACLFGGALLALLIATHLFYPRDALLPRYDFLFLAALAIQVAMLAYRLESAEEAGIILIFHMVGTTKEVFKTSMGSWAYP